jgi:hypothetical protein
MGPSTANLWSDATNIIAFPIRHKGRKKKIESAAAEGMLSLWQFGIQPENVVHFDQREIESEVTRNDVGTFISFTLLELSPDAIDKVRRKAWAQASLGQDHKNRRIAARVAQLLGVGETV